MIDLAVKGSEKDKTAGIMSPGIFLYKTIMHYPSRKFLNH
ncbi:hypothetical protein FDUTEX481_02589 [Tolypothrix sp. PCC 7601]|nr:hypothetical protein FDUTEX481_02589 [Tolypothrix sp. PCC 7601]